MASFSHRELQVVIQQTSAVKLPLHIVAFVGLFISVVCGFSILWKGKQMGYKVLMCLPAKRLPMYIAMGDILFSTTHWFDHLVVVSNRRVPDEPGCSVFAWFTYMGIMMSVCGALFLASFAFYRLIIDPMNEVTKLGKFDTIPLSVIWGIPLLLTGLTYYDGAFGAGTSWCIFGGNDIKKWAALNWFLLPICLVMAVNMISYGTIMLKMNRVVAELDQKDSGATDRLIMFTTEMKVYMIIYIYAFIPIAVVTAMGAYSGNTDPYFFLVLDYIVVCTVNLNGTLNAVAFHYFSPAQIVKRGYHHGIRLSACANRSSQVNWRSTESYFQRSTESHVSVNGNDIISSITLPPLERKESESGSGGRQPSPQKFRSSNKVTPAGDSLPLNGLPSLPESSHTPIRRSPDQVLLEPVSPRSHTADSCPNCATCHSSNM